MGNYYPTKPSFPMFDPKKSGNKNSDFYKNSLLFHSFSLEIEKVSPRPPTAYVFPTVLSNTK